MTTASTHSCHPVFHELENVITKMATVPTKHPGSTNRAFAVNTGKSVPAVPAAQAGMGSKHSKWTNHQTWHNYRTPFCFSHVLFYTLAMHIVLSQHHLLPCRGDANAAGLIFQGWDAAGEGSAAIVYDWERSVLEAVYQAPPRDMGSTQQTQVTSHTCCRRLLYAALHLASTALACCFE